MRYPRSNTTYYCGVVVSMAVSAAAVVNSRESRLSRDITSLVVMVFSHTVGVLSAIPVLVRGPNHQFIPRIGRLGGFLERT